MKKVAIGTHTIGAGYPPFIIAEAGVNHNGDVNLALKLIDAAKEAGADAIKFQTFKAHEVATDKADMAEYQKKNLNTNGAQIAMLKKLELQEEHYPTLIEHCKKRNIMFLSTPHGGIASINFLETLNHPAYKIASPDIINRPLLERAAKTKKPIILSTGMATLKQVRDALRWITKAGNKKVIILHCTSNYPTPPDEVNLRAMQTLSRTFGFPVGFSDHTEGMQASVMAVTLGACVIEKHFTLDRSMEGPDHTASLEPAELAELISSVRTVERCMGSPQKQPTASERAICPTIRRSIVSACPLKKGEKITLAMLAFKRPGTGISPAQYKSIIGKKVRRDLPKDHLFISSDYGA